MGCGTVTKHMSVSPWLAGEGYELVGYDCYRGDAHLFEIALVNYQP